MSQKLLEAPKTILQNLPIFQHYSNAEIVTQPQQWQKGQKGIARIMILAMFAALGWAAWTYVVPPLFTKLGQTLGAIGSVALIVIAGFLAPVFWKWCRWMSKGAHKALIRSKPFEQLEDGLQKMRSNKQQYSVAKATIIASKNNMELEAHTAEKEAKEQQENVISTQSTCQRLKQKLESLKAQHGDKALDMDEYITAQNDLFRKLGEAGRLEKSMNQNNTLVQRYGTRANVMGKLLRKLNLYEISMDSKIADFESTIQMLKKEAQFAKSSKDATNKMKELLGVDNDWEVAYAFEIVNNTVALDNAITQQNIMDLDRMTASVSLQSEDEMFEKLNQLTDRIKGGDAPITDASKFNNPNYVLTKEDKAESGGFGNLFGN